MLAHVFPTAVGFLDNIKPEFLTWLRMSPPYNPHAHHRNGMAKKAQWKISEQDERRSFAGAWDAGWHLESVAWGFHFVNGGLTYLGVVEDHETKTFFAKFVRDPNHVAWHGYPANQRNPQDIPDLSVAQMWIDGKVLARAKIRKIIRMQPCRL